MKDRIIVYTCIIDDYDTLNEPYCAPENVDYVCFTDNRRVRSRKWRVVVDDGIGDSVVGNRYYKMHPHLLFPDYQCSVYVDGNIRIIGDMNDIVDKYLHRCSLAVPRHFQRTSVSEEYRVCRGVFPEQSEVIERQMREYGEEGFPDDLGLSENNILVRRHNDPRCMTVMKEWWDQFSRFSKRDQLSLAYSIWKHRLPFTYMDESSRNRNGYFYFKPHRHYSKMDILYFAVREKIFLCSRKRLLININYFKRRFFN
ncbi:MAG: DUF616 domain-containing protein [Spirochaetes bacterium]|nr:DUF616 domain-containing protein [Spirochaetota bacterium]